MMPTGDLSSYDHLLILVYFVVVLCIYDYCWAYFHENCCSGLFYMTALFQACGIDLQKAKTKTLD